MSDQLSLSQIKRAYHQAAKIVARYGDKYLPIFERMEEEYKKRVEHKNIVDKAKKIASLSEDFNLTDI
jgi:hypothetical protein